MLIARCGAGAKVMSSRLTDRLAGLHPQMLRVEAEGHPQKLADLKVEIGHSVERALDLAGLTKQEAAFAMGYTDQGVISRWCSGTERPLFDKLYAIEGFEEAWIQARAERNRNIEIQTVVTIRRRSA